METPTVSRIKKFLSALKKMKRKYVTCEMLSKKVSLYPDVIEDELSYFDPMIKMDTSTNVMDLVPSMEEYLLKIEEEKAKDPKPKRQVASKKEMLLYPSIVDFVYDKMTTPGGLVDTSVRLSDHDLHVLSKLIEKEVAKRKKEAKKSKKG